MLAGTRHPAIPIMATPRISRHNAQGTSLTSRQKLVFLHSSDGIYGADRMLLEMVGAVADTVEVEVWLPNDLKHPRDPLCHEFIRRNVLVRHLRLPIMRQANRNPRGLIALLERSVALFRELRAARPQGVYCTTSPTLLGAPVARLAGVPRVIGHSQEIWSRADRYVLTWLALACHTVLAISNAVADSMPPGCASELSSYRMGHPNLSASSPWRGDPENFSSWSPAGGTDGRGTAPFLPPGTGPEHPVGSWCSAANHQAAHRLMSPPWSPPWHSQARFP